FITPTYATIFNEQTEYSTTNVQENILFVDNFNNPLNWSTSDNTVYIKDNTYLYTTTDGHYDDWAEKTFDINLSKNYNIIIEQRMKIESGGWGYRLPIQKIIFENNYILDITYLAETNYGWNFDGWTKKQEPIIPGTGYWTSSTANYWTITKIIINSTGGELQIKPDDIEKNWHSNEFIKVIAKNWTHKKINKIIFRQTWDSVNYIDYIKITKEPITTSPTYPTPTESATMIINSNDWQDLSLAQSTGKTVIFTREITDKIKNEIQTLNTDQLWYLGEITNINQLNTIKIQTKDHINNIFFNTTNSYYTDKEHAIMATLIAAKDNIPLTFKNNNNAEDLTQYTNEQLTIRYLNIQKENIDNIIITNTNDPLAFIAPQLSKKYQGIPLIITTGITPDNNITQNQIKNKLTTLATTLSKKGFYTKNKDYKLEPVYITILGDFNAIPPYQMDDKGREYIKNIDGNIILSDLPYADFYDDGKIDTAIGRITNKNQLYIKTNTNQAKILSQYRHGKYADVIFLGGGMMQGYDADKILNNTDRSGESRINVTEDTLKNIKDMTKKLWDFATTTTKHSLSGFLSFIKTFMDLASMIMSIFFESDWDNWKWYLLELPPHLDNLETNTFKSLNNTQIFAFFGVGNSNEITMHKQKRSELKLILWPYANGPKITQLNYNNFFML
ncbi:hypothetical protein KAU11_09770, partial [Candidatus Babeliales bacterium]|nr:hypothetical protein [Candidatus Babeliales bacterium]